VTAAELIAALSLLPPGTLITVWDCGYDREAHVEAVQNWDQLSSVPAGPRLCITAGDFLEGK
jgi:hypothetical protein